MRFKVEACWVMRFMGGLLVDALEVRMLESDKSELLRIVMDRDACGLTAALSQSSCVAGGVEIQTVVNETLLKSAVSVNEEVYLPQTRYYGSKRRLIQWMMREFKNYEFETALDVFGGTSTVSLALKRLNKKVTYNDILESNRNIAVALLSNEPCVTTVQGLEDFIGSVKPRKGFISKNYHGVYYTDEENKWLDGALSALSAIRNPIQKSEVLYCLMQACLQKRPFNLFHRKNLYLRENNKKDTKFGNWATWEKPFSVLMVRALGEVQKARWESKHKPVIMPCTDAIDLPSNYDFVYLDPPYVPAKKQDISYMDRYHFLEGLCLPGDWEGRIDYSKKNLPISSSDEILKWNTKKHFKESLFELVDKHRRSIVCLSYVHGAYPSIQEINDFFSSMFKKVALLECDMPHALSKSPKKEVIIIGSPR
ncbi:DNA adenine methylase [Pseudomonas sp. SO81]|uniref:DNA adenine methylase n=1 Tax=Pseudomonas sp. SO81 TaxID=2983246 RepID=UPI0025A3EC1B|nr:DNA adenine methylase [Pseudomonas sp. SO81]